VTALLTPEQVGEYLRVRDRRTVRKRLAEFGVPVVAAGRSYLVRAVDLERAVAVAAVTTILGRSSAAGVVLPAGARLWDAEPENQVSPRRANGRARGTRDQNPVQEKPTHGPSVVPVASLRARDKGER
jgi:hypothetical protein